MTIRKAEARDISAISWIYEEIHTEEETGNAVIGWIRGVYPTEATALQSLQRGDLFVAEADGKVVGAAIINQRQVDVYAQGSWEYTAPDEAVMVLHTLVISPSKAKLGYGKAFVQYYAEYARSHSCRFLRMDTNARNLRARGMYQRLGYHEAGIVPCVFNGIENVQLVLLEKKL